VSEGGVEVALRRWRRPALIVLSYGMFVVAATYAGDRVVEHLAVDLRPTTEPLVHRLIMLSLLAYVLLMALPFVPGVEIGLALIFMIGPEIVPVVYGSTVLALLLAFTIGQLVPERLLEAAFVAVGLRRAAALVARLRPLDRDARIQQLVAGAPGRLSPWLLRHRHWAIAAVLNIPGNNLVGGGGGIALAAGMSRLVSFRAFLLTVALGTAPLPVVILVTAALR
jgi:hypothetical protein